MYEAKVVVLYPEMGGGYDDRPGAEDYMIEEFDTYEEAQSFVDYWKSFSDFYEKWAKVLGNRIRFISGSVKEID